MIGSDWDAIKMNHSLNYKPCYAGYKIAEFYNTEGAANPVRVCVDYCEDHEACMPHCFY